MVVVGVEQNAINEGPGQTLAYMNQFGWNFPVIRDTFASSTIFTAYDIQRDNWVVVDASGIVAYKSGSGYTGEPFSTHREAIIATLDRLGVVPVQPTTWGSVKALYR